MVQIEHEGRTIGGKYLVQKKLGEGGMGVVYQGEHLGIGKRVAIKLLHGFLAGNEEVVKRFYREARAAAAVSHRNIIDVLDVGVTDEGEPFIVMEFLVGEGLAELIEKQKRLDIPTAIAILEPALLGLGAAHDKGIVHRDLKPDNIFIALPPGSLPEIKLIDFGISKFQDARATKLTVQGTTMGTPAYMSPEQARGAADVNHLTDIYAMGVILYEMLSGDMPYAGEGYNELLYNILTQDPRHPQEVYPAFPIIAWPVIQRALSRDPAQRFDSALQMLEALRELCTPRERQTALTTLIATLGVPNVHPADNAADVPAVDPAFGGTMAGQVLADVMSATMMAQNLPAARPDPPTRIATPTSMASAPVAPAPTRASFIHNRRVQIGASVAILLIGIVLFAGPCSDKAETPSADDMAETPETAADPGSAYSRTDEAIPSGLGEPDTDTGKVKARTSSTRSGASDSKKRSSQKSGTASDKEEGTAPKKSKNPFRSLRNDLRDAFGKD